MQPAFICEAFLHLFLLTHLHVFTNSYRVKWSRNLKKKNLNSNLIMIIILIIIMFMMIRMMMMMTMMIMRRSGDDRSDNKNDDKMCTQSIRREACSYQHPIQNVFSSH